MAAEIPMNAPTLGHQLVAALQSVRGIELPVPDQGTAQQPVSNDFDIFAAFAALEAALTSAQHDREAFTFAEVLKLCTSSPDFGGLGIQHGEPLTFSQESEVLFLVTAWLEALNSNDRAKTPPKPLLQRPAGRRGMTISEKILAMHDIERRGSVKPGDLVRVDVDWVIASEASWKGMEETYELIGKPGIFRNDRFWLAADHIAEPRTMSWPVVRKLVDGIERAKKEFKMTEYQGVNYTIMHTEFFRERAQPGMLVVGSDSHTCSAGAVSALAVGLGAADVIVPLVTGETFFKVPETINIRFVGKPPPGVGGKDTILYVLNQFKRNTVAAERFVEYTGPGLQYLSADARFAICNMTTEFGGVTGIFESDERTLEHVQRRGPKRHKNSSLYFKADADAQYAETFEVDLSKVESAVAIFPSPDDVKPVGEVAGMKLDGCFIGACTTAEEDIILAALVLEEGLKAGRVSSQGGRRLVIPGSRPIRHKLDKLGLTEVYEKAGFEVGIPGCSMCVGHGADQAGDGEVWLSSQNRNFKNRMGKGSIANLASAATVAASSFDMQVTDPRNLLDSIDQARLKKFLGYNPLLQAVFADRGSPQYVEPCEGLESSQPNLAAGDGYGQPRGLVEEGASPPIPKANGKKADTSSTEPEAEARSTHRIINGRVLRLGDYIDTDAIAPAQFLLHAKTNEEIGEHCFEYSMPEFRGMVGSGFNVVVGGQAFGCGSSREQAVSALLGCGVQCVIAKSFAFIYARNQPNLGLLGITITDERFYEKAEQGAQIHVDLAARKVVVDNATFGFQLSQMEEALIAAGGISSAFHLFGKRLFDVLCSKKAVKPRQAFDVIQAPPQTAIF